MKRTYWDLDTIHEQIAWHWRQRNYTALFRWARLLAQYYGINL